MRGSQNGLSNNPVGKPKGSKHKRTKEWEALGEAICTKHADKFNTILETLDDEEFIKAFGMILQYFKPKLASTTIDAKVDTKPQIIVQDVSGKTINEDENYDSV